MSVMATRGRRHAVALTAIPADRTGSALAIGFFVLIAFFLSATAAFARPAPQSFADLAAKVTPAVVYITTEARIGRGVGYDRGRPDRRRWGPPPHREGPPGGDFFRRRHMDDPRGFGFRRRPGRRVRGVGSGFIIDADGYIVTNNHVIRNADRIRVKLHSGETYTARLIGRDRKTDLALLKIDAGKKLPFVRFGDSDKVRVGDWILAVGNPFGLGGTVTAGILSARGRHLNSRTIVNFLQIDAPINRGNSGGPTFNVDGEVIGVNTAIFSPNGGNVGLGFAIPSNTARQVVEQLRATGRVSRGWLGVAIQPVTAQLAEGLGLDRPRGALIASVSPDSPAARAGLRPGDVVLVWDGKPVAKVSDLPRLVANTKAGQAVTVTLWRGRAETRLSVTVGKLADRRADRRGPGAHRDFARRDTASSLARLGLRVVGLDERSRERFGIGPDTRGVLVVDVDPESDAARAGLRSGDVITTVALRPVLGATELAAAFDGARKQGRKFVTLGILRRGASRFVALRLART